MKGKRICKVLFRTLLATMVATLLLGLKVQLNNENVAYGATTYRVTYYANGGSGAPAAQTKTHGKSLTISSTKPSRAGYSFAGWGKTSTSTTAYIQPGGTFTTNMNLDLYAIWKPNTYYISFNGNGSTSGSTATMSCKYGTSYTLNANGFARTGYTFNGWSMYKDGSGTRYSDKKSVSNLTSTNNATVTLYAQWKYTVSFNGNGATSGSTAALTLAYSKSGNLTANGFARTGYTFNGWNTADNGSGTAYADKASVSNLTNRTLYAQWKANTYTVSFDSNSGSAVSAKSVSYNSTYGTLPTPTRTGYTFAGWFTAASGGSQVTASSKMTIAGNSTLYAHWNLNSYTISFNGNGSTSGSTASMSCKYDTSYTLNANGFVRTGYTFTGWSLYKDGSGTGYSDKKSVSNLTSSNNVTVTLYAQWKANTYTVSFSANGGDVETASKSVTTILSYFKAKPLSQSCSFLVLSIFFKVAILPSLS